MQGIVGRASAAQYATCKDCMHKTYDAKVIRAAVVFDRRVKREET